MIIFTVLNIKAHMLISLMTTTQCLEDMRWLAIYQGYIHPVVKLQKKKCRQRKIKKAAHIQDEQVIDNDANYLVSGW